MSQGHQPDTTASVRVWEDIISRARFDKVIPGTKKGTFVKGTSVKAVAHTMSRYADRDGSRVFPGIARLAVDCEVGYDVAARIVSGLRELGLIELVHRAKRRGAKNDRERTDEYRLALPVDLLDRLVVPTPSDYRAMIDRVAKPHRPSDLPPSGPGLENPNLTPAETGSEQAGPGESNPGMDGSKDESNPGMDRDLTPDKAVATYTRTLTTSATSHSDEDLRADPAATRERETAPEDPNFEVAAETPPALRIVTGGGRTTPAVAGLWPTAVPTPEARASPGALARADIRRKLATRPRLKDRRTAS